MSTAGDLDGFGPGRRLVAAARPSTRAVLAVVLGASLVLAMDGCKSSGPPVAGDVAPEFVLQSLTGQTRKLSNYRGKVVLVNLWATWCPPCVAELPVLDRLAAEYADKGLVVLGVAGDENPQAVRDFLANSPVKFEVLFDPNGAIGTQYGITGYPETFFVDRAGKLRDKIIGAVPHKGDKPGEELTRKVEELLGG